MAGVDPLIELEKLKFGYSEGSFVLRDLDFSFSRGEKAVLHGSNGSGKTTLFHVIMGLLKPQSGRLKIFGRERRRKGDFHEVRRRVGLLFQDSDDQLFCPTVQEDIAFGPLNLGKSREETGRIITRTLDLIGLPGFEERITYRLSGGEKRLVALGTVLAMEPELLLLDEPVAGLDDEHREKFIQVLKSVDSYLIISHDRELLDEVIEKSYVLKGGKITQGGPRQRNPEHFGSAGPLNP
jgi:cobalt/nickel transport system ATP-binding protein